MTGCGLNRERPLPELTIVRVTPPAELLDCAAEPSAPAAGATQRAVARYLLEIASAGDDCRAKLEAVRAFVSAH